jgi:hypothetical protein
METRLSRLTIIAALALLTFGPATACPSDPASFLAHPQGLITFSSDIEDESVSSYIRELSAASIVADIGTAISSPDTGLALGELELLSSPAALTGLAGLSDTEFLLGYENDFTSAITGPEPEDAEPAETAETAINGQEDR